MSNASIGKWISLLYRYGHIYVTKELEPYNIGKGQFLFLLALYHKDGLPQEELAGFLNIDKGTTARAIDKLEKAGYVKKEPNQKDLRSNQVFLTQQAKELEPHIYAILHSWTEILITGMTEAEVEKAFSLLTKMAQNATDHIQKDRNSSRIVIGEIKL
ncbi:MAG: MarR family transcriptional regulator [Clostridia bacterium]|jgi:DNA-binding MarR family transcriptional regulator|nr:MarR family transcriptional regulator [Clostridia bacterium]